MRDNNTHEAIPTTKLCIERNTPILIYEGATLRLNS